MLLGKKNQIGTGRGTQVMFVGSGVSSHLYHESSHIFQALLTSPQLISALVSSSHLISALLSALSNHLSSSRACNLLQKRISAPKQATPALSTGKILHREAFALLLHTASLFTQQTFTERSFYTQIAWRSCVCQGIRGGCMKDLPGCSWELLAKGVVGRSCKVLNISLWEDLCRDPGAVLEEVLAWSSTGPCEQILRRSCWKPPQAALGLCIGACMKVFLGCS